MRAMNVEEARRWCTQEATHLKIANEGILHYESDEEPRFVVNIPSEHRRIVALAYSILLLHPQELFEGGLIWLRMWEIGSPQLVRPGWKIVEGMRRAQGDLRSLDIAPAQLFRHDEFVELHAFLIQVMAFGWSAYFVPSAGHYFLDFRATERFYCRAKSSEKLEELFAALKRWSPANEGDRPQAPSSEAS